MKSKLASRIVRSILVVLPAAALSACADGPEVSAFSASGSVSQRATDSDGCRSARQTAELVRQMQMTDGGIPFAIPAECENGAAAKKREAAVQEPKPAAAQAVMRSYFTSPFDMRSPG